MGKKKLNCYGVIPRTETSRVEQSDLRGLRPSRSVVGKKRLS